MSDIKIDLKEKECYIDIGWPEHYPLSTDGLEDFCNPWREKGFTKFLFIHDWEEVSLRACRPATKEELLGELKKERQKIVERIKRYEHGIQY